MHVAPESNTTKTKKATKNKKIILQNQIRKKTRKEVRKIRKSPDRHSKWLQISRQARPYSFNRVIKRIAIYFWQVFWTWSQLSVIVSKWSALVLRMARPNRYPPGLPRDGAARAILVHSLFCSCLRVRGLTRKFAQALRCLPQTLGVRSGIAFLDWAPSTSILIKFQFSPFHTIFAHFRCHCLLGKSFLKKHPENPDWETLRKRHISLQSAPYKYDWYVETMARWGKHFYWKCTLTEPGKLKTLKKERSNFLAALALGWLQLKCRPIKFTTDPERWMSLLLLFFTIAKFYDFYDIKTDVQNQQWMEQVIVW